jgi:hypothetical protein
MHSLAVVLWRLGARQDAATLMAVAAEGRLSLLFINRGRPTGRSAQRHSQKSHVVGLGQIAALYLLDLVVFGNSAVLPDVVFAA